MKELIYSNFQLTRATGVPTAVVIDGVLMAAAAGLPHRSSLVKASKPAAARRTEAVP